MRSRIYKIHMSYYPIIVSDPKVIQYPSRTEQLNSWENYIFRAVDEFHSCAPLNNRVGFQFGSYNGVGSMLIISTARSCGKYIARISTTFIMLYISDVCVFPDWYTICPSGIIKPCFYFFFIFLLFDVCARSVIFNENLQCNRWWFSFTLHNIIIIQVRKYSTFKWWFLALCWFAGGVSSPSPESGTVPAR